MYSTHHYMHNCHNASERRATPYAPPSVGRGSNVAPERRSGSPLHPGGRACAAFAAPHEVILCHAVKNSVRKKSFMKSAVAIKVKNEKEEDCSRKEFRCSVTSEAVAPRRASLSYHLMVVSHGGGEVGERDNTRSQCTRTPFAGRAVAPNHRRSNPGAHTLLAGGTEAHPLTPQYTHLRTMPCRREQVPT